MLLEKQATKQMTEQKNTSIKRVKAMKDLKEIKNSWYLKKQLTNTQIKKLDASMPTLKEALTPLSNLMIPAVITSTPRSENSASAFTITGSLSVRERIIVVQ